MMKNTNVNKSIVKANEIKITPEDENDFNVEKQIPLFIINNPSTSKNNEQILNQPETAETQVLKCDPNSDDNISDVVVEAENEKYIKNSRCYVCKTQYGDSIGPKDIQNEMKEIISQHLNIKVDVNIPLKLCSSCANTLLTWSNFYQRCQNDKNESSSPVEDSNENGNEDFNEHDYNDDDFEIEYLEEEQALVNEAVLYQKKMKLENNNKVKIITTDKKLEQSELNNLLQSMEKIPKKVFVLKSSIKTNLSNDDIYAALNNLKVQCVNIQGWKETEVDIDNEDIKKMLESFSHLLLETVRSENDTYYQCNNCPAFLKAAQLPKHCLKNHGTKYALCDLCRVLLPYDKKYQQGLVKEHVQLHREGKSKHNFDIVSNICTLLRKNVMKTPEKNKETKCLNRVCDICNERFRSITQLRKHLSETHFQQTFECNDCLEKFSDQNSLIDHQKLVHNIPDCFSVDILEDQDVPLICEDCNEVFSTRSEIYYHKKKEHGLKTHICSYCTFSTTDEELLKSHVQLHVSLAEFSCEKCNETFSSKSLLNIHNRDKHFDNLKVLQNPCPLCNYSFPSKVNLRKHFNTHIKKNETICKVCGEEFKINGDKLKISDVIEHKRNHTDEQNKVFLKPNTSKSCGVSWCCRHCGLVFYSLVELRKHTKTHSPYFCEVCKTVSTNENTFRQHLKLHSGNHYSCSECGKLFVTRNSLLMHARVHSPEPTNKCLICNRRFWLLSDLRRHNRFCRQKLLTETSVNAKSQKTEEKDMHYIILEENGSVVTNDQVLNYISEDGQPIDTFRFLNGAGEEQVYPISDLVTLVVDQENRKESEEVEIVESDLAAFKEWQQINEQKNDNVKAVRYVPDQKFTVKYVLNDHSYQIIEENKDT